MQRGPACLELPAQAGPSREPSRPSPPQVLPAQGPAVQAVAAPARPAPPRRPPTQRGPACRVLPAQAGPNRVPCLPTHPPVPPVRPAVPTLVRVESSVPGRCDTTAVFVYLGRGCGKSLSGWDSVPARKAVTALATALATLRTSACSALSASSASWLVA